MAQLNFQEPPTLWDKEPGKNGKHPRRSKSKAAAVTDLRVVTTFLASGCYSATGPALADAEQSLVDCDRHCEAVAKALEEGNRRRGQPGAGRVN